MAKSTKPKGSRKTRKSPSPAKLRRTRKIKAQTRKPTQKTKGKSFLTHHSAKKNAKPQQVMIKEYKRCIHGTHHVVPRHWRSNPYGGKKTAPGRNR